MSDRHDIPPLLCTSCGCMMNATANADAHRRAPKDGDIAVCVRCGTPYLMGAQWLPLTTEEFMELPEDIRSQLHYMRRRAEAAQPFWPDEVAGHA